MIFANGRLLPDSQLSQVLEELEEAVNETRACRTLEPETVISALQAVGERGERFVVITSEFHLARAEFIAATLGLEVQSMGAETTQWISKMNYYLREVFALAKAVVVALVA